MNKIFGYFAKFSIRAFLGLGIPTSLWAQEVVEGVVEEVAPALNSGDTAWMLTSSLLVIFMSIPAIALFYGGLTRSKNMLSVLMQVFVIFSLISVLWCLYGYSLAFSGEGKIIGNFDKALLIGITPESLTGTIPEFVWISFQLTFAALTAAIIVGSYAERVKFTAVMAFSVLWFTLSYVPIAHIVWGGGFLTGEDLDFAGGTVVHINAGMAGLVGAYLIGKRIGFGREPFMPHSLTMTMIGASMLWIGWFGFNAGSAGAANGIAGLAFLNTTVATGAATVAWAITEAIVRGKPSMLGAVSGAVAGLVAITPAAGFVGVGGAIAIGIIVAPICFWGVSGLKRLIKVDDAFDVFGIHGVGGIVGAILTGVFAAPYLGGLGNGKETFELGHQLLLQTGGVLFTVVWSGVISFICFKLVDVVIGLRVSEEHEREGLDITSHGESAYRY